MERLHWRHFLRDGEWYGVRRSFIAMQHIGQAHTHDFVEVWWVDTGSGHHLVNGTCIPVQRGDLVLMRSNDGHAFGDGDFAMTNVFFRIEILAHLRERYFSADELFWGGPSPLPLMRRLTASQLLTLCHEAERLAQEQKSLLRIERFLINLLDMVSHELLPSSQRALPGWLQHACRQIREPEHLRQGVSAFVQLTGKSPEHVARVVRQLLDTTPHQLVTEARMAHAAVLLEMTPRSIIDIALDCGYDSLSRFYRVFKDTYHVTPRGYRQRMPHV